MKNKDTIVWHLVMAFVLALMIAVAILATWPKSQMDANPVTVDETSQVVEEEEGPDFMLLPLPGGVPVGGGLYIW